MSRTDWDSVLRSLTAISVAIVGSLVFTALISIEFIAIDRQALFIGGGEIGATLAVGAVMLGLWMRGAPRQVTMWAAYFLLLPLNIAIPLIVPFQSANTAFLCWSAASGLAAFGLWFALGLVVGYVVVRWTNRRS